MAKANVLNPKGAFDLTVVGGGGEFVDAAKLSNSTPYIKNPTQVRLITPPKGLLRLPNGQQHVAILKQLIETRNKTWTGFNPNLDLETHQIPWGWDRQMLTIPTTTIRQALAPSLTADSYYDNSNVLWWQWFAKTLYAHPDTQKPNFAAMDSQPDSWTFEDFSFAILAWEPNAVGTKPLKAVLCSGMTLSNIPEIIMERNITATRTGEEHSIAFNCVYEDTSRVLDLAQGMMDAERASTINPEYRPVSITGVDADVLAADGVASQRSEAKAW
jgi:hypothetical protein